MSIFAKKRTCIQVFAAVSIVVISLLACTNSSKVISWYRGNTHAHTDNSDGDASPDLAAAWYLRRGYNFLCITDHNILSSPKTIKLPADARKDFIVIAGQEITGSFHATAMNILAMIPTSYEGSKSRMIQKYQNAAKKMSGILIVNHPNYEWALSTKDIRPIKGLRVFEVYNCYPSVRNEGNNSHISTEAIWDELLTDGMVIYGVASDDTHSYSTSYRSYLAGPGKGWVMVYANELTPRSICNALVKGHFYASIGVVLKKVEISSKLITIEIDKEATEAELIQGTAFGRPSSEGSKVGERIDFIGTGGRLIASSEGLSASYTPSAKGYVRARAVVTRIVNEHFVEFCAWTQPVFLH